MKKVTISKIKIVHFKGLSMFESEFGDFSRIHGDNGTGKSTVADAYMWCLLGTNTTDRSDFKIQPLGTDNQPNIDVMPEVEVTLSADGVEWVFTRRLVSKFSRPTKDNPTSMYKGSEAEYLVNGVPVKAGDFREKLESICPVDRLKILSTPGYFNTLTTQDKRKRLQAIAPEVSDMQIAQEFPAVASAISKGKTPDELKREVAASRTKSQQQLDRIPARKDEQERARPQGVDFAGLRIREKEIETAIETIDNQLRRSSDAGVEQQEAANAIRKELANIQGQMDELKASVAKDVRSKRTEAETTKYEIETKLTAAKREQQTLLSEVESMMREIAQAQSKLQTLRNEWAEVNAEQFEHHPIEVCHECKRPFTAEEQAAMQGTSIERFNSYKITRLDDLEAQARGINASISSLTFSVSQTKTAANETGSKIENLESELRRAVSAINAIPTEDQVLGANSEYKTLSAKAEQLQISAKQANPVSESDLNLLAQKNELQRELKTVVQTLTLEKKNAEIDARIKELTAEERSLGQSVSSAKEVEYQIEQFEKHKILMIEESVSSLFEIVKFKMFEQNKTNDGEQVICECLVDGVPYNGNLNTASKINAGIDIVNAFSKAYGVSVPLWIDNKESVTSLLYTPSQVITLEVSKGQQLTIINQ